MDNNPKEQSVSLTGEQSILEETEKLHFPLSGLLDPKPVHKCVQTQPQPQEGTQESGGRQYLLLWIKKTRHH